MTEKRWIARTDGLPRALERVVRRAWGLLVEGTRERAGLATQAACGDGAALKLLLRAAASNAGKWGSESNRVIG